MSPMAHHPSPIPARSLEQRADALAEGNRIRSVRARIRRDIHDGTLDPLDALRDNADDLASLYVIRFVQYLRYVGPERARLLLRHLDIAASKRLGGLSERQRIALEWALPRYGGGQAGAARIDRDQAA